MIMTLYERNEWEEDDKRDENKRQQLKEERDIGYWDDEPSKEILSRWTELDEEEIHDLKIIKEGRYMHIGKYVNGTDQG